MALRMVRPAVARCQSVLLTRPVVLFSCLLDPAACDLLRSVGLIHPVPYSTGVLMDGDGQREWKSRDRSTMGHHQQVATNAATPLQLFGGHSSSSFLDSILSIVQALKTLCAGPPWRTPGSRYWLYFLKGVMYRQNWQKLVQRRAK